MKKSILLIGMIVLFAACGAKQDSKTKNSGMASKSIAYEVLVQDSYGGADNPEHRVITNAQELRKVYGIINRTRKPGIEVPEIDFSANTVVAIFMGERSSGGNHIEIEKVEEHEDGIEVKTRNIKPGTGEMTTMAITHPFIFVKLPVSGKEITVK